MRLKTAKRIINRNRWKAAVIRLTGSAQRTKQEKYLLKQIEKAKAVIYEYCKTLEIRNENN